MDLSKEACAFFLYCVQFYRFDGKIEQKEGRNVISKTIYGKNH